MICSTFPTLCALACLTPLHADTPPAAPPPTEARQQAHPYFDEETLPRWSLMTAEQAKTDFDAALGLARERIRALENITNPTYENTFAALDSCTHELDILYNNLYLIDSLTASPAHHAAIAEIGPAYVRFKTSLLFNEKIWRILLLAEQSPWMDSLPPERKRHAAAVMAQYRRNGAELPPDTKRRLLAINGRLSILARQYTDNIAAGIGAWEYVIRNRDELSGLSAIWQNNAHEKALAKNLGIPHDPVWLVTLEENCYTHILGNSDNDALREKIWRAHQNIGSGSRDNAPVIHEILALRQELAHMLGHANYAEKAAAGRMIPSGENAARQLASIRNVLRPQYETVMETLRQHKASVIGNPHAVLAPWDRLYYANLYLRKQVLFDPAHLCPYFRSDGVISGMFALSSQLYGITVAERPVRIVRPGESGHTPADTAEVWSPGVRCFDLVDTATGTRLGTFYLDLAIRSGKRPGSWTLPLKNGKPGSPGIAVVSSHLLATTDSPAYWVHNTVASLFHEYGHILHLLLTATETGMLSSINSPIDFAEYPSTFHENLSLERGTLDLISQTPIPEQRYNQLLAYRRFTGLLRYMQMCDIACIDLELHLHPDRFRNKTPEQIENEILQRHTEGTAEPCILRNAPHLFAGRYAAGYYAYLWGHILAADTLSRFRQPGIQQTAIGAEYRRTILGRGITRPAAELYRSFMGHSPKPDAWLQSFGIKPQKEIPSDAKTR